MKYSELEAKLSGDNTNSTTQLQSLIQLGSSGHYPLFFDDWVKDTLSTKEKRHISYKDAKIKVKSTLKKLEKHKSLERKKIALMSFKDKERQNFIKSFLKMVEFEILDHYKDLH